MNRSRLSNKIEQQSIKTLLFSIVGILFVIFILIKFSIPLLANLGLFLSSTKNAQDLESKKSDVFIAPPVLNATFDATNSAQISISGTGLPKQTVKLYINGEYQDKVTVKEDHSFIFEDTSLTKGENLIQTKAVSKDNEESEFSNQYIVAYKKDAPSLSIESPSDNQSFSKDDKTATVKGKTDIGIKVTINDFRAIVDESGNFLYTLPLKDGDNTIKIKAIDDAGNTSEKEIKVKYSS